MKNPLITTVIPIYNVEQYIGDTIDCIIKQDIGFEDNVRVILVDDGSPDNSAAVCEEYVQRYPKNIVYIKQKNGGVSAARNNGFMQVDSDYVHFLDSDDIISKNAYSRALTLLKENTDVDLAALRVEFFEGQLGKHPLDYKFTGDRVIRLDDEPNSPVLHISSCIMRRKAVEGYSFDSTIKISEDMKFLTEFLQKNPSYITISSATYFYRKRQLGGSAIDGSLRNRDFYLVTPDKVYRHLLNSWRTDDNKPHKYVQYVVAYDLQWRLRQKKQTVLDKEEEIAYKKIIYGLIRDIDTDIWFDQRFISIAQLMFILRVKNKHLDVSIRNRLEELVANTRTPIRIDFIEEIGKGMVRIEGWMPGGSELHGTSVYLNEEEYQPISIENIHRHELFLGELVYDGNPFYVDIPEEAVGSLEFHNQNDRRVGITTKRQSGVPDKKYGYRVSGNRIYVNGNESIHIYPATKIRRIAFELRWIVRILVSLQLRSAAKRLKMIINSSLKSHIPRRVLLAPFTNPAKRLLDNVSHVFYRVSYYVVAPFMKEPVWILSDRFIAAGDNGEALFDYIKGENLDNVHVYFAIAKGTVEYNRLKEKYGKEVIDSSGFWYRILFLHSSKIISSHADDVVVNPFGPSANYYYDLFKFDFIFLQHGVIRNDMSTWLNRYGKNIKLFVTSAEKEYQSILKYKYYYTPSRVLLSGLPRYDLLKSRPKKKLILAPTWRHSLATPPDPVTGERPYNSEFKETEYCLFFNRLMNDNRLTKALENAGMVGELYLHPALQSQTQDFDQSSTFVVKGFPYDYRTAFEEGSILVTDYSSVLFDFAYLKKPIVYAQFDQESFFANQAIYTKGYMEDSTDGFGPVTLTIDETIDAIISYIESNCQMEDIYKNRVDDFFKWHDGQNRKRVLEAVRGLGNEVQ